MSNVSGAVEHDCESSTGCGAIELILNTREKDLGGFVVRRALPTGKKRTIGPWIFFDHMGPAIFPAGKGVNVRPHPHIGIATVSYLFDGEILHRDSLGSYQTIQPGDINLMVAGSGIVHSERERNEVTNLEHRLHGLQLWLALPEAEEEIAPAFFHYPGESIPCLTIQGVSVRVMMGAAYGKQSPVKTFANTLYVEAFLKAGQSLLLPDAEERGIYTAEGNVKVKDTVVPEFSMAVLTTSDKVEVEAITDSRLALIGGKSIGNRFIEWNFVSSRKERIEQAKLDWKEGRFAKVPGDEEEFIPLPD